MCVPESPMRRDSLCDMASFEDDDPRAEDPAAWSENLAEGGAWLLRAFISEIIGRGLTTRFPTRRLEFTFPKSR